LPKSKSPSQTRINLVNECTEMLCVKEGIFHNHQEGRDYKIFISNDSQRYLAIFYNLDDTALDDFLAALRALEGTKHIYMFSESDEVDRSIFAGIAGCKLEAIPQKILEIYRLLNKQNISPKKETIKSDITKAKKRIFEEKEKDDGVNLLRIVLEQVIKVIAFKHGIDTSKIDKIARVNQKLRIEGVFDMKLERENKLYLTIGNYAHHAEYHEYDMADAQRFYDHAVMMVEKFGIGEGK